MPGCRSVARADSRWSNLSSWAVRRPGDRRRPYRPPRRRTDGAALERARQGDVLGAVPRTPVRARAGAGSGSTRISHSSEFDSPGGFDGAGLGLEPGQALPGRGGPHPADPEDAAGGLVTCAKPDNATRSDDHPSALPSRSSRWPEPVMPPRPRAAAAGPASIAAPSSDLLSDHFGPRRVADTRFALERPRRPSERRCSVIA